MPAMPLNDTHETCDVPAVDDSRHSIVKSAMVILREAVHRTTIECLLVSP